MKLTPDNITIINLSPEDMNKAVEYWLNRVILKKPCRVLGIEAASKASGSSFKVEWTEKDSMDVQIGSAQ